MCQVLSMCSPSAGERPSPDISSLVGVGVSVETYNKLINELENFPMVFNSI